MGWCSATQIFDDVMDAVVEHVGDEKTRRKLADKIAVVLWLGDWDCEGDSKYYERYLIPIMLDRGYIDSEDL